MKHVFVMKKAAFVLISLSLVLASWGSRGAAPKPAQKAVPADTGVYATNLHCADCANKVRENLSFMKGVKDLDVSLERQRIQIVYNPLKTGAERFAEIIRKLGYKADVVKAPVR